MAIKITETAINTDDKNCKCVSISDCADHSQNTFNAYAFLVRVENSQVNICIQIVHHTSAYILVSILR